MPPKPSTGKPAVSTPTSRGVNRKNADRTPDSDMDSPEYKRPHEDLKLEIRKFISDKLDELRNDLKADNESLHRQISELREEIARKDEIIRTLEGNVLNAVSTANKVRDELFVKSERITALELAVDELEQYGRRTSVRISGLGPLNLGTDFKAIVADVAEAMACDVDPSEIDRAHPVGKDGQQLIVKFTTYTARAKFFESRRRLKDKRRNVFINEDLTARRHRMLQRLLASRKEKKIDNTWTKDGRIFALVKGKRLLIRNDADIDNLLSQG